MAFNFAHTFSRRNREEPPSFLNQLPPMLKIRLIHERLNALTVRLDKWSKVRRKHASERTVAIVL